MPRQGQSVESCIITAWNKKVGDAVEKGDILFSYETDKSSFDEAAPESGKLLAIFQEEGDDVPCLENVCVIGADGEDFAQFAPAGEAASAPAAEAAPAAAAPAEAAAAAAEAAPAAAAPASALPEYEDVKMPNIRKIIAKQMCASLTGMAQLTLNTSFDATKVMELRKSLKAGAEKMGLANITLNDIILYAVSRVILNHKGVNAHCLDETIRYFNTVNLGVAVDSPRGLMVPTVFHAEKMSLNELSKAAKGVISAAQGGTINPDLLKGATFTISNLGAMGIESFTPIINPPQVAILGVDCITRRVKEVNGEDVFYSAMGLSLTFDHRVLDGADAARFLKDLVFALENFDLLLVK